MAGHLRQHLEGRIHDGGLALDVEGLDLALPGFGLGHTLGPQGLPLGQAFGPQGLPLGQAFGLQALGLCFDARQDRRGVRLGLQAHGPGVTFGADHGTALLGLRQNAHTLALRLGLALDRRHELGGTALGLSLLDLDLLLLLDDGDLGLLFHLRLLRNARLDVVGAVGLCLLPGDSCRVVRLTHLQVALGLGLRGLGEGLSQHAVLVGPGAGLRRLAQGLGLAHGDVARRLGLGNLGHLLVACDLRPAHVLDIARLFGHVLEREGHDLQAELVEVGGDGLAHAGGHELRVLDQLLDGELAHDAAQMALHHLAHHRLAVFLGLAQELVRRAPDLLVVVLDLELGNGLHFDGDTLVGVQGVARRHVKAHQLQVELVGFLEERHDHGAAADDDARAAASIDDQCAVGADLAVERAQDRQDEERSHDHDGDNHVRC